jgi:uncharacterized protein YkwD
MNTVSNSKRKATRLAAALALTAIAFGCDDVSTAPDTSADAGTGDAGDSSETPDSGGTSLDASIAEEETWPADWVEFEERVLELVNVERASGAVCGRRAFGSAPALVYNAELTRSARGHSEDMAVLDFFDHDSPDGREFSDRITAAGYTGGYPIGENIAVGYINPQQVVDGWMESVGHCENIMNTDFRTLGTGYFADPQSEWTHYWTQNFGGAP